jgi:hypothetical protein
MNREQLESAYRSTDYWVDDVPGGAFLFHIGEPCDRLRGEGPWAFITACNPHSRALPDEANAKLMTALEKKLDESGWRYYRGRGIASDRAWQEASLLVLGIGEADARKIGEEFGQNAIVVGGGDGVGRLLWLR